jgi:hypothetical protein
LARTYTLVIPGWLTRRFNELAPHRDYSPLPPVPDVVPERFATSAVALGATLSAKPAGAGAGEQVVSNHGA